MFRKPIVLLPLATALASLAGAVGASVPNSSPTAKPLGPADDPGAKDIKSERVIASGEDLLGFLVTTSADGTVVAQHSSHSSHSSHASHASHASSRQ